MHFLHGMSIADIAIAIVVIAAIVALVCVALRHFEITPPAWAKNVFWIIVVTVVVILAIRFVADWW